MKCWVQLLMIVKNNVVSCNKKVTWITHRIEWHSAYFIKVRKFRVIFDPHSYFLQSKTSLNCHCCTLPIKNYLHNFKCLLPGGGTRYVENTPDSWITRSRCILDFKCWRPFPSRFWNHLMVLGAIPRIWEPHRPAVTVQAWIDLFRDGGDHSMM